MSSGGTSNLLMLLNSYGCAAWLESKTSPPPAFGVGDAVSVACPSVGEGVAGGWGVPADEPVHAASSRSRLASTARWRRLVLPPCTDRVKRTTPSSRSYADRAGLGCAMAQAS